LATLGSLTQKGSFLFYVVLPKVGKARAVVLLLTVLLMSFTNVNDPLIEFSCQTHAQLSKGYYVFENTCVVLFYSLSKA
jgi:hypothetical protein